MSNESQMLLDGLEHHKSGRLQQAEAAYRRILQQNPDHADALNLLGVVALQAGQPAAVLELINRSVQLSPSFGSLNNLGEALRHSGRLDDAIDAYRRSLELNPQHADAWANLGLVFVQQQKRDEAINAIEHALQLMPRRHDLHDRLGSLYNERGDPYRAAAAHRNAISIQPTYAPAHANLGLALSKIPGGLQDAFVACQESIRLAPNAPEAHAALATVFERDGRLEDAVKEFELAGELNPGTVDYYGKRAVCLEQLDRVNDAIDVLLKGLQHCPTEPRIFSNLSSLYRKRMRYPEAIAAAESAVKLAPSYSDGHGNLSLALLSVGNYERGFAEYEWRWRCDNFTTASREFNRPQWNGTDPKGRTILVHTEQGFGDTLQFARYLPMLADRGASVIVECHHSLRKILGSLRGVSRVIPNGLALPDFDLHTPLLSLPQIFRTSLSNLPADVPYLHADADLVSAWRERVRHSNSTNQLHVGLIWAGNVQPDRRRTVPGAMIAELGRCANAQFFSLQKHDAGTYEPLPQELSVVDLSLELTDFHETAAVMTVLDLIITIDTGPAHLAGALGRPTWVLLPWSADWRWLSERDDSPWYPTVRLFRQTKEDDWTDVIARVTNELAGFGK